MRLYKYRLILAVTIIFWQKALSQSSCFGARAMALDSAGESPMIGAFVPECDSDGNYKTTQCHGSTGQCWCAKKDTGEEIEGTRVNSGQDTVDCDAAQSTGPCNEARVKALAIAGDFLLGTFIPECDSNGYYNTKQCYGIDGKCWCADRKSGDEIEGTRVGLGQQTGDCDAAQSTGTARLDENDACYKQNKEMIDEWNKRLSQYDEIHMERWKKNMDDYEQHVNDNE